MVNFSVTYDVEFLLIATLNPQSSACKQVEGCVDADVIVGKFCDFFVKSYACNNARQADELRQEYVVLRQNYTVVSQLLIMITLIRRWSVKLFLI